MPALGWLMNLGFAGGTEEEAPASPDVPGVENRVRTGLTDYRVTAAKTDYQVEDY